MKAMLPKKPGQGIFCKSDCFRGEIARSFVPRSCICKSKKVGNWLLAFGTRGEAVLFTGTKQPMHFRMLPMSAEPSHKLVPLLAHTKFAIVPLTHFFLFLCASNEAFTRLENLCWLDTACWPNPPPPPKRNSQKWAPTRG